MMTIKKLTDHRYSQCHVEIASDGGISFFSYITLVCHIDAEGWLECTGTYSQTTRKQIGWFLKEYAPAMTYHMVKQAYIDNMAININTAEVIPL